MAGYHFVKTLHSASVIIQSEPSQLLTLPPYTTFLYRLLVSNIANAGNNIVVRISTRDTLGNTYVLAMTPKFSNGGRCSISAAAAMSLITVEWNIANAAQNITITDEIEVLG